MNPLYVTLAAFALSLVSLVVSVFAFRASPVTLQSEHRALQLDVTELYDKVDHWMKRERVRKVREGQDAAVRGEAVAPPSIMTKAELRRQVFGGP